MGFWVMKPCDQLLCQLWDGTVGGVKGVGRTHSIDEEGVRVGGLDVNGTGNGKGGELHGSADESRELHGEGEGCIGTV